MPRHHTVSFLKKTTVEHGPVQHTVQRRQRNSVAVWRWTLFHHSGLTAEELHLCPGQSRTVDARVRWREEKKTKAALSFRFWTKWGEPGGTCREMQKRGSYLRTLGGTMTAQCRKYCIICSARVTIWTSLRVISFKELVCLCVLGGGGIVIVSSVQPGSTISLSSLQLTGGQQLPEKSIDLI